MIAGLALFIIVAGIIFIDSRLAKLVAFHRAILDELRAITTQLAKSEAHLHSSEAHLRAMRKYYEYPPSEQQREAMSEFRQLE